MIVDADERRILAILLNTNRSIFDAQKSNTHRIKAIEHFIGHKRLNKLKTVSVDLLDEPLDNLRNEIFNMLMFSREYTMILKNIDVVNIYDATEIIVEIGDIRRFKTKGHFISYAGLAPVVRKGGIYSKVTKYNKGKKVANKKQDPVGYCENLKTVLTRCTKKLIQQDNRYKSYYNNQRIRLKRDNPMYHNERINLMALKKTTIKFAKYIYKEFNKIVELEEYEKKEEEKHIKMEEYQ